MKKVSTILGPNGKPASLTVNSHGWYEASHQGRGRIRRPDVPQDARTMMNDSSRRSMMGLSRWLRENTWLGTALESKASYAVDGGWIPQYRGSDPKWGNIVEERFWNWMQICDIGGRLTFHDFLKLGMIGADGDGDAFVLLTSNEDDYPLLQAIPGHRCEDSMYGDKGPSIGGVVVNQSGRPLGYRFRIDKPNQASTYAPLSEITEITARDVHHMMRLRYSDQYRGMSMISRGGSNQLDAIDILGFEKVAVKMASAIGLLSTNEDGATDNFFETTKVDGQEIKHLPLQKFAAGMMPVIPEGFDLKSFAHNRPGQTFQGFMEFLTATGFVGIDWPIELVFGGKGTGPAQRLVIARAVRCLLPYFGDNGMLTRFAMRVWGYFIGKQNKLGLIPEPPADWYKVEFSRPKSLSIDTGRDSKAMLEELRNGANTLQDIYGEAGQDYEDRLRQKAKEAKLIQDLAIEYGVPATSIQMLTPNGNDNNNGSQDGNQQDGNNQ